MKKYLIGAAVLLVIIALVATPIYLTKRKKAQTEKAQAKVAVTPSDGSALDAETETISEPKENKGNE